VSARVAARPCGAVMVVFRSSAPRAQQRHLCRLRSHHPAATATARTRRSTRRRAPPLCRSSTPRRRPRTCSESTCAALRPTRGFVTAVRQLSLAPAARALPRPPFRAFLTFSAAACARAGTPRTRRACAMVRTARSSPPPPRRRGSLGTAVRAAPFASVPVKRGRPCAQRTAVAARRHSLATAR
jgi:hypothetical protein